MESLTPADQDLQKTSWFWQLFLRAVALAVALVVIIARLILPPFIWLDWLISQFFRDLRRRLNSNEQG